MVGARGTPEGLRLGLEGRVSNGIGVQGSRLVGLGLGLGLGLVLGLRTMGGWYHPWEVREWDDTVDVERLELCSKHL